MNNELRTAEARREGASVLPVIDSEPSGQSVPPNGELTSAESDSETPRLNMRFLAFDGQCIPKLGVLVKWAGGSSLTKTDAGGCLPPIEAPSGVELKIAVERFNGTYKEIGSCPMPATESVLTLVSPKMVFEIKSEPHVGTPGDAEGKVPRPEAADRGDWVPASGGVREAKANVSKQATPVPANDSSNAEPLNAAKPALKPTGKSAEKFKQAAASVPQHISGGSEKKPTIQKGRDASGNPFALILEKVLNWWNSWQLPTLDLWRQPDPLGNAGSQGGTSSRNSASTGVMQATTFAGPVATPAPVALVSVSADMKARLDALLTFAEEQTRYRYADNEGTVKVLNAMKDRTFNHSSDEKKSNIWSGRCYQYVRIALSRANIVDKTLAVDESYEVQNSASKAALPLRKRGFVDVTDLLPDARWAAAGDIIVYEWTPTVWEERKKKAEKKKKGTGKNLPNHGHIDIRSVETYISDYMPDAKHPTWSNYQNIRIYRKVFDPLPTLRIKAFLRCLREFECQQVHDDSQRYRRLNTALPTASGLSFSSYDSHPWEAVPSALRGDKTAAGAYQIVYATWKEKFDQALITVPSGKPRFTPEIQDRIAVMKIEDRLALHLVRAGKVEKAVTLQSMRDEWTSLPGGKENAKRRTATGGPMDTAYFRSLFDNYLTDEKRKVGLI